MMMMMMMMPPTTTTTPATRTASGASSSRRRRSACFVGVLGALSLGTLHLRLRADAAWLFGLVAPTTRRGDAKTGPGQRNEGTSRNGSVAIEEEEEVEAVAVVWADTPQGRACHELLPWRHDGRQLSYAVAWNALKPEILNASFYPDHFANLTRFRHWVSDVFEYHDYERLRKTQAHPAPRSSVLKIWDVIARRLEDPIHNGPVRIAVMGDSVTAGRGCDVNALDLPDTNHPTLLPTWCAFPHRLQVLLDRLVFPRRSLQDRETYPLFEVTNMAVPGTNSQVGALAMEYHLVPALQDAPPHIVIASYSANDALGDEALTFGVHQQDFVRAAHQLRPCDDHLPLLVLADDWHTHENGLTSALANTGSLYKTAAWHDLMAVMYSNAARTASVSHANFSDADKHPLFGSSRTGIWHLGMGFHVALAWTLFFNLLGALHDACSSEAGPLRSPSPPPPFDDGAPDGTSNRSSRPKLADIGPTKYMGRYDDRGRHVLREWDANQRRKSKLCSTKGGEDKASPPLSTGREEPYATSNCAYAWMVNPMTSVATGPDVQNAIGHVLTDQRGWVAHHHLKKSGWLTTGNASLTEDAAADPRFAIELRDLAIEVDTFTLLSFKSYGPDWIDSRLRVDIEVIPGSGSGVKGEALRVFVDGYHAKTISVPYPHRFQLPKKGAQVGDTIRASFTLVNGTTFKIVGMAFCQLFVGDL